MHAEHLTTHCTMTSITPLPRRCWPAAAPLTAAAAGICGCPKKTRWMTAQGHALEEACAVLHCRQHVMLRTSPSARLATLRTAAHTGSINHMSCQDEPAALPPTPRVHVATANSTANCCQQHCRRHVLSEPPTGFAASAAHSLPAFRLLCTASLLHVYSNCTACIGLRWPR